MLEAMAPRPLLALLVFAAATLGGCKTDKAPDAGAASATGAASASLGPMDPLTAEVHEGLVGFRDRACKCVDFECANKVVNEMGGWILNNRERFKDVDQKSTPAQIAAAKAITAELNTCARAVAPRR